MPDETTNGQDAPTNQQSTSGTGATPVNGDQQQNQGKIEDLPHWAQVLVKELRDESAARRLALRKQEDEAAKATQARLADEGKWKELADARAAELAKVTPYQQRAETLEKMITENNLRVIQQIPEQMRTLVPQLPPEQLSAWLSANQALLTRKPAPETDAGAGTGSGGGAGTLTDDEKRMAALIGITNEAFAKAKK